MNAPTERDQMSSFNVIAYAAPFTDEEADRLVDYLRAYSPVVDGDGRITVTIEQASQNLALALAVSLMLMFDFVTITQVEVMTTAEYDATYIVVPT